MMKKLVTALALSLGSLLIASAAWAGEATQVVKDNQSKMFDIDMDSIKSCQMSKS